MKLLGSVVLVLSLAGVAFGITDMLRAGTNAARGALGSSNSLMNMGLGNAARSGPSQPGQQTQNRVSDAAQAMAGSGAPMSNALSSVRSAANTASSFGDSALASVSAALSLSSLMTHPWVLYLINLYTRVMAYFV